MEPLYTGHQQFVPYSELSIISGASSIFPVGMVVCNWDVEYNLATFSELFLYSGHFIRMLHRLFSTSNVYIAPTDIIANGCATKC